MSRATKSELRQKGRAGRNSARAFCRQNQEGRYGLIPGPSTGLDNLHSYKEYIWSGSWLLPSREEYEERPYVLCTVATLMEFFLVMENGKRDLDRKGLV